jgi:hypothetical protein
MGSTGEMRVREKPVPRLPFLHQKSCTFCSGKPNQTVLVVAGHRFAAACFYSDGLKMGTVIIEAIRAELTEDKVT